MAQLQPYVRHGAFTLGSLYWLIPGHATLAVTSVAPVDALSIVAIALLWLLCYGLEWSKGPTARAQGGLLALVLLALCAAHFGHGLARQQGLQARYYDNPDFQGSPQSSWASDCRDCTRIDKQIAFGKRGHSFTRPYFALFFANDHRKRLWSATEDNGTDDYRFSARWTGFLTIPETRGKQAVALQVASSAGQAELTIAGKTVAAGQSLELPAGVHGLELRYARRDSAAPSLELSWDLGEGPRAIPARAYGVEAQALSGTRPALLSGMGLALWLAALAWLIGTAAPKRLRIDRMFYWAGFMLLFVKGLREIVKDGKSFGFQVFKPGNDYLMYESYAREILAGDWLSRIESPFIFLNFAYRYLLSALHLLAGEAPADVVLLQQAGMAFLLVAVCAAVVRLYGRGAGLAMALVLLVCNQMMKLADPLLDTLWSIGFSTLALIALIDYARAPKWRGAAVAGLALGLAALLRPNFLPLLAVAFVWVLVASRASTPGLRPAQRGAHALLTLGLSIAVLSLLAWRNFAVGGEWRWLPDNGLINLWIGNHPAQFDGPTYFVLKEYPARHEILPRVLDYLLAQPAEWLSRSWQKGLYLLGIDIRSGLKVEAKVLLPWLIAAFGSFLLWRGHKRIQRAELALLWLWIALINAPLIMIFPWGYGWRLSAPSFIPLYLLCGLILAQLWQDNGLLKRLRNRPRTELPADHAQIPAA
ncbi:MAG: hypothetical protein V4812_02570 [Pseudomonadota bacterium]